MAGNNGNIVRDITETHQALTTTPDYQSPNGFGAILQGVTEGFSNLISGATRGSGKGSSGDSNKHNQDLYNLYKGAAETLSNTDMGEEEFILFDKNLHNKALALSGGDFNAMNKAIELAQYKPFSENLQKLYTRNAANEYAQMDLINTAGSYSIGVDAPADVKERAGIDYLNRQTASNSFIQSLRKTSPSQQSALISNGNTPGLVDTYSLIKQGFRAALAESKGANPGVVYDRYYNSTVSGLTNSGMDFAVADKIVSRALIFEKASLFGDGEEGKKASSAFGRLSLAEDYMSKQNKLQQDLADSRLLAQEFTMTTRVPGEKELRTIRISGADLASREKNFPNTIRTLTDNQYLELVPQLFNEGPQTYRTQDLNFMFSTDAGNSMNVNGSDESGKVNNNIITGQSQGLDTTIKEKEQMSPESLKGKGFADISKLNQTYSVVNSDSLKYTNPDLLLEVKDKSFKSIAKGSDAESGKEGFWQVDDNGQLHYYTGTMWAGEYILLDSTDSNRLLGIGSEGSENMRRYAPEISKWLGTLENTFGIDKKRLYEDFNRSQIRDTIGAQSFRVNQLQPSAAYYGGASMNMTEEDIDKVLEAVNNSKLDIGGISVGIAQRAAGDIIGGIKTAAEETGKLPGRLITEGPRAVADVLGVTKIAEGITNVGLGAFGGQQGRAKAMRVAAERSSQQRQEEPTRMTETTPAPRETQPYGEKAIKRNNPGNIKKDPNNNWEGMSKKQDSSDFVTFDTIEDGYRAMSKTLDTYFKKDKNTIAEIVSRWAPSKENPTREYIEFVANEIGVDPNQELKNTPEIKSELIRAMVKFENGAVPKTADQIQAIISNYGVKPVSTRFEMPAQAHAYVATEDFPSLNGVIAESYNDFNAGKLTKEDLEGRTVEEYAKDYYNEMVADGILRLQGIDPDTDGFATTTGVIAEAMNESSKTGKDVSDILYEWYNAIKYEKTEGSKKSKRSKKKVDVIPTEPDRGAEEFLDWHNEFSRNNPGP